MDVERVCIFNQKVSKAVRKRRGAMLSPRDKALPPIHSLVFSTRCSDQRQLPRQLFAFRIHVPPGGATRDSRCIIQSGQTVDGNSRSSQFGQRRLRLLGRLPLRICGGKRGGNRSLPTALHPIGCGQPDPSKLSNTAGFSVTNRPR